MKNAIVIGASSGIGKALVELLLKKGWKVGITGRRLPLLEELKATAPGRVHCHYQDIQDVTASPKAIAQLWSVFEKIDLVIVSSGMAHLNSSLKWELEKESIQTNVVGTARVYQFVYEQFKVQGYGHLVGISSIASIRGNRHSPSYGASKAFQANYLEALRCMSKKHKHNIDITDIQPGFVDTAMAKGDGLFWVAAVDKAARQILHAIEQKKRKVYVSRRWGGIAFLLKRLPAWLYERI